MAKRALLAVGVLLLSSCATMRYWNTPLSPAEGQTLVPALITAGQQQGLNAYHGTSGAVVELEDGTMLSWQDSAAGDEFILLVQLPGDVPEQQREPAFNAAKQRADQLWAQAVSLRGAALPAVMVMPGAAVMPPQSCQRGSDGVEACGYGCRIGSDGRAACAATPDGTCELNSNGTLSCGRNCQLTSSGYYACQ